LRSYDISDFEKTTKKRILK